MHDHTVMIYINPSKLKNISKQKKQNKFCKICSGFWQLKKSESSYFKSFLVGFIKQPILFFLNLSGDFSLLIFQDTHSMYLRGSEELSFELLRTEVKLSSLA